MPLRTTRAAARVLQCNLDGGVDDVTPRKKRDNEELRHQILLFDRRLDLLEQYPDLRWMFATLNGIYIPPALLKQVIDAGLVPGVLDIFLPVPRIDPDGAHYCGLAMDLKKLKGGRPSKEQKEWAAHLSSAGWRVYFPAGCVDAWRCVCAYLGIAGSDHWAADLQQQEEYIRLVSEDGGSRLC